MIIIKTKTQFNPEFVYFLEPIKNNIINEGNFIRIIYSSSIFMLNGVYIMVDINSTNIEKFYNKYKYSFDINQHKSTIDNIGNIEKQILNKYNIENKKPQYNIYEQLQHGFLKVFSNVNEKKNS